MLGLRQSRCGNGGEGEGSLTGLMGLRPPASEQGGAWRGKARFSVAVLLVGVTAVIAATFPGRAVAALPSASGFLSVCKQAGPGIAAGDPFDFTISLSGVTRIVTVSAGGCQLLEAPREGTALTKGYFRNDPDSVTQLVPAGAKLVVDAQALTASQLQAVLVPAPGTSATTNLLLNLAQQLLAADLNILRGVQPPAQVSQAIADANATIQITIGGAGEIRLATTLTSKQISALVKTLTAFNEGKLKGAATPTSANLRVAETIPPDVELTAVACNPLLACSNVDLNGGSLDVTITSGFITTVTFVNRSTLGTLRLCKAAGTGIAVGSLFKFSTPVGDRVVTAGGDCLELTLPEVNAGDSDGKYAVSEYGCGVNCLGGDMGFVVTSIVCDSAVRCSSTSESVGTTRVGLVGGGTTTVTFTNRSSRGTLRLCKAAGTGIAAGTVFRFSTPVGDREVAAGECIALVLPEVNAGDSDGKYAVSEYGCGVNCLGGDMGFVVTSIVCDSAVRCSSTSESVGTTRVGLVGGDTTTVTFTNRSSRGTLRLCKAAGTGIAVGSLFKFSTPVGDRVVTAGGDCLELTLPEVNAGDSDGRYEVSEYGCGTGCLGGDLGHAVASIVCDPAVRCSSTSEFLGLTRVGLVGGGTTTVTFTNRSSRGTLRLCKAAGTGIAAGTVFRFSTPVGDREVAAGECIALVLPEVNAGDSDGKYAVSEYGCGVNCLGGDMGFVVTSIVCDSAVRCSSTSESVGTTRVGLVGGDTTTVTFTNQTT